MTKGLRTKIKMPKVGIGTGTVPGKLAKNKLVGTPTPLGGPKFSNPMTKGSKPSKTIKGF